MSMWIEVGLTDVPKHMCVCTHAYAHAKSIMTTYACYFPI